MQLVDLLSVCKDEAVCRDIFKEYRDRQGVTCKRCGCKRQSFIKTVYKYQCLDCGWQSTLRSGTLLEASKLPYRYWIFAIAMMTSVKKSISALEMQRQLGHKRYEPVWAMMHKIRVAMGNRDERYKLDGLIEVDDAFFRSYNSGQSEAENKPGRGTTEHSNVLVMCKVDSGRPDVKHKKDTAFRYVKMHVMPDQKGETVQEKVKECIAKESHVISDGFRSFSTIKQHVASHLQLPIPPKLADKVLPWVHTTIANAKRQLLGTHSGVKDAYLQNYLSEYCYKTNRRHFGFNLFDRFMTTAVEETWYRKSYS
jgi:hypothetical protein